jgi:protoporphyrinogen oxidase
MWGNKEDMKKQKKKQAIIVGAGPAGLTAAYELLKNAPDEFEVIVLEQSNEVGGLSRTVHHAGNRIDLGGHRFFSKDERVTRWWKEMLPLAGTPAMDDLMLGRSAALNPEGPNPQEEDEVLLLRRHISHVFYDGQLFDEPVHLSGKTVRQLGLRTTLRIWLSYGLARVYKMKETSLENIYINRFGKVMYSMFFKAAIEKTWGRPALQIPADAPARRMKGLSASKAPVSAAKEFLFPKLGAGQMWETVARKVQDMGGHLLKNCRAVGFRANQSGQLTEVQVETQRGKAWLAGDVFISSMPVKDLVASLPNPPKEQAQAADALPYRDFAIIGLLVRRLALQNTSDLPTLGDIVPDCWIVAQDEEVKMGRIQIFNNWSPYMVKDPQHTVWLGLEYFCSKSDEFWNMEDEECVKLAQQELEKMGVLEPGARILGSHLKRVGKAAPASFGSYKEMASIKQWLESYSNLICIGQNGQHRKGNMADSILMAFAAADHILGGRTAREDIWRMSNKKIATKGKGH